MHRRPIDAETDTEIHGRRVSLSWLLSLRLLLLLPSYLRRLYSLFLHHAHMLVLRGRRRMCAWRTTRGAGDDVRDDGGRYRALMQEQRVGARSRHCSLLLLLLHDCIRRSSLRRVYHLRSRDLHHWYLHRYLHLHWYLDGILRNCHERLGLPDGLGCVGGVRVARVCGGRRVLDGGCAGE
ncbi:hypothetical protein EI94DRAFT_1725922 [Lactarius quietus]|nr:hypothetical protein EI94DRAFT_1725922 [Lactarius quietus]